MKAVDLLRPVNPESLHVNAIRTLITHAVLSPGITEEQRAELVKAVRDVWAYATYTSCTDEHLRELGLLPQTRKLVRRNT